MPLIQVAEYSRNGWNDSAKKDLLSRDYCQKLEEGNILFFPAIPFNLPSEDKNYLLNVKQTNAAYHKNIAYRPKEDRVTGFDKGVAAPDELRRIMRDFSKNVTRFFSEFLIPFTRSWKMDYASFRPVEEEGRQLPTRSRNDLIHTDAFPTRPTHGGRILRIFANINPTQSRVWVVGDPFEKLAEQWASPAGLEKYASQAKSPLDKINRSFIRAGKSMGLPLIDRSPYDRFMLNFHNYLKENSNFQDTCPKYRFEFPPGSAWICFTDTIPHSVLSGQFALEHTYIISPDSLVVPQKSPIRILERLSGTSLSYS